MSVRDYNKVVNFKNTTTGECYSSVDYDSSNKLDGFVNVSLRDFTILSHVLDCLQNNHGILITIGYKK